MTVRIFTPKGIVEARDTELARLCAEALSPGIGGSLTLGTPGTGDRFGTQAAPDVWDDDPDTWR